jgi:hypothetical protein
LQIPKKKKGAKNKRKKIFKNPEGAGEGLGHFLEKASSSSAIIFFFIYG